MVNQIGILMDFDWRSACMDAERRYMETKRERDFYIKWAKVWEEIFYCDECRDNIHACQEHSTEVMMLDKEKKDL